MEKEAPGLFRCSTESLMLVPPAAGLGGEPHLLAVTFRPLVWRRGEALQKAA